MTTLEKKPIAVVGAGIAGLSVSLLLARAGFSVELIERRRRREVMEQVDGRSVNFTITDRGLKTLEKLGLKEQVLEWAQPLCGRVIHERGGFRREQSYGPSASDLIHSIRRARLVGLLLQEVEKQSGVTIRWSTHVTHVDRDIPALNLFNENKRELFHPWFVIAADGSFSAIRTQVMKGRPVNFTQEFFEWPYLELKLSQAAGRSLRLDSNHLHVFPQSDAMVIAIPNSDRSLSAMLLLKDSTRDPACLLREQFPVLALAQPGLLEQVEGKKLSWLPSVSLDRWYHENKIVLLGDACHAVFPFFGQGMNMALEDALALSELLTYEADLKQVFTVFQERRKPQADALKALSRRHFTELYRRSRFTWDLPASHVHAGLVRLLSRFAPHLWPHEYRAVAAGELSFVEALRIQKFQSRLLCLSGLWIVDLLVDTLSSIGKFSSRKIRKFLSRKNHEIDHPADLRYPPQLDSYTQFYRARRG